MKFRTGLAALAAVAALTLTACGSDDDAATPAAPSSSPAAPVPSAAPSDDETSEPASDAVEPSPDDESSSVAGTSGGGDSGAAGDCEALGTLVQDFSAKILGKATSGGVTQAAIDEVFAEETVSQIPETFQADVAKLKELSGQLVGKPVTEVVAPVQEITTVVQGLADKIRTECTS